MTVSLPLTQHDWLLLLLPPQPPPKPRATAANTGVIEAGLEQELEEEAAPPSPEAPPPAAPGPHVPVVDQAAVPAAVAAPRPLVPSALWDATRPTTLEATVYRGAHQEVVSAPVSKGGRTLARLLGLLRLHLRAQVASSKDEVDRAVALQVRKSRWVVARRTGL